MEVEINVEKTLEAIDKKINELDVPMNILYKHMIPMARNHWLKVICGVTRKKSRNSNRVIKRNVKKILAKRISYAKGCETALDEAKKSNYGVAIDYLSTLEARIKRVSLEFPNQPIMLSEKDLDIIFMDITQKDLDKIIEHYVWYYSIDRIRYMI
jgi:hypothetical protein